MRTATVILLSLCFSSLIITGLGQTLIVTDSAATPLNYDLVLTDSKTTGAAPKLTYTATTTDDENTVVSSTTYNAVWTKGLPLISTYEFDAATAGSTTEYLVINLSVGGQVVAITADTSAGGTNTAAPASSATAFTAASACGSYYVNGVSGVISFSLIDSCAVTVTQVPAVTGVIQYNENTPSTSQLSTVATNIAKAANMADGVTTAVAAVTGTASGSTLVYYAVTGMTAAQIDDVQEELQDAIYAKTITVDGLTQLNGFATETPASASAGTAAPSTTTSANILAAYPKAHSRMIAVVGVFTTVLAAFFGLAL